MIAGRLNEIVEIYSPTEIINDFGERQQVYQKSYTTRAKVDYSGGGRGVENDETVYNYIKTFNLRSYVPILNVDYIKWQGNKYRVLTLEKRREYNDIVVTAELIND